MPLFRLVFFELFRIQADIALLERSTPGKRIKDSNGLVCVFQHRKTNRTPERSILHTKITAKIQDESNLSAFSSQ